MRCYYELPEPVKRWIKIAENERRTTESEGRAKKACRLKHDLRLIFETI